MGTELLITQVKFNAYTLKVNADGITHDESLQAPAGGGNCFNWVAGHVVSARNTILKLLGHEPVWSTERAEPYRRGSEPLATADALPLEDIFADCGAAQKTIVAALEALGDDALAAPSPAPVFSDDETLGASLAGLVFHESYHMGQLGLLRRMAGKAGAIR